MIGRNMRDGMNVPTIRYAHSASTVVAMMPLVHFLEVLFGDVGVDLRGRDGGVPEHRLDVTQLRPTAEEIGGEAMPERVRVDVLRNPRSARVSLDEALDGARGEWRCIGFGVPACSRCCGACFLGGAIMANEEMGQRVTAGVEIGLERCLCTAREEHDANLPSFSAYGELLAIQAYILSEEGNEFADAYASRIEHL